ncbi:MAG: single-stranded DNA-binding protein [Bacteroidota bacterium]|nr:single-stranded DNA-binding protein [Bacteroidota bacterium]
MAYGLNRAQLIGRVGTDLELKYTANGIPVCNFRLATTMRYKTQDADASTDRTEWHNIVAYRKAAEIIKQYGRKGGLMYIEGKLQTRSWDDKNHPGVKHYMTEIIVDDFMFLEPRGNGGAEPPPVVDTDDMERGTPLPPEGEDLPF